jgi:small neutral amino acid transporter SnatA (MarC family)
MATRTVQGNWLQTGVNYLLIALAICALLTILYVFLSQGHKVMKKLGKTGNLIINKLVAFITFCIGIQIMVTGISKIFHINIL